VWRVANAISIGLLIWFWVERGLLHPHLTSDGSAYWGIRDGRFYEYPWLNELHGGPHPYVYSPAFAQIIWPLTLLELPTFIAIWVLIQLAAVAFLAGPLIAAVAVWLYSPLGLNAIWAGQIAPLMALALALAPRHPAAWSFLLLTKVTPGVGMVWHAARLEWKALAVAVTATLVIIASSALLFGTDVWVQWFGVLRDSTTRQSPFESIPLPLGVRVGFAAVLIAYGARRDWWWALPAGVTLALPHVVWAAWPILFLASIYWWRTRPNERSILMDGDLPIPR
jgi:hypothetical protein